MKITINLFIPHAFYYSIAGKRKEERPPDVGPHSIWWPHYRKWAAYWARVSCLMTDIDLHAETAVLCRNRELLPDVVRPLFEQQTGFRYLPESVWPECQVQDGALTCRGEVYRKVIDVYGRFPELNGSVSCSPDCLCESAQPTLRCARFLRSGTECWFLTNEGNEAIHTTLTLLTHTHIGSYDQWNNAAQRQPYVQVKNGVQFALELPARGSRLYFACSEQEYLALSEPAVFCELPAPAFTLLRQDPSCAEKVYRAKLTVTSSQLAHGRPCLTVCAEEMAELTVNGVSAGAEFWSPQRFCLDGLLTPGENELVLTVTGSRANLYGEHPVWYGLTQQV